MKKKVEQDGHAQFLRNLRKFRRNLRKFRRKFRKFRTCPEVPDIPEKFAKSKLKIKYFKDAAPIPFHGINDDQDEDYEDQLHEEEDQQPIQRQRLLPHPRVHQSIQSDHPKRALEDLNGSWMIRSLW